MDYYFFLNRAMISQSNKKQRTVLISITKAKYIALGNAVRKVIQIRKFINKMKLKVIEELTLYKDNKINIALTKNKQS